MMKDPDSIRDEIVSEENQLTNAILLMLLAEYDEQEEEVRHAG